MHYLSRREEKKRKERNGKLIICNYWRVSSARYDRWNRSYATKIATIRRYTEGRKKKKKRASSYLLRQCFQSRNLETFFFATGFTVYVPLSIFRGIFNRGSSSSLIFHDPYRIFIIHDDIGARISSRFPKSIRATFKFPRDRRPFIARSLNRGGRAAKIEATSIETWWL